MFVYQQFKQSIFEQLPFGNFKSAASSSFMFVKAGFAMSVVLFIA